MPFPYISDIRRYFEAVRCVVEEKNGKMALSIVIVGCMFSLLVAAYGTETPRKSVLFLQ